MIGEANSGKTSLLLRFIDNKFEKQETTIAVDFRIKNLMVDSKAYKMQIMDTAGQERFRSISQAYYRKSQGCIAVYDITDRESFHAVEE